MALTRNLIEKIEEEIKDIDANREKVRQIFDNVKKEGRTTLLGTEAKNVVKAYDINVPPTNLAHSADEAAEFAEEVGFPTVIKITGEGILHKSDIGGVKLMIKSKDEARKAFEEIMENTKKHYPDAKELVEVQYMVPLGRELITGVLQDPQFGPMVMIGLGGIYTNFMKDAAFGLSPITFEGARKVLQQTKTYTLLKGVRGEAPSDIDAVLDTLVKISHLAEDFRQDIDEMDINPFFVYEKGKGISAVDVKITLK